MSRDDDDDDADDPTITNSNDFNALKNFNDD